MNRFTAVCTGFVAGGFVVLGIANSHAQTAADILSRADAVYTNARTYQTTYRWEHKSVYSGRMLDPLIITSLSVVDVKALGTKQFTLHQVLNESNNPPLFKDYHGTIDMVDDGVRHYVYLSSDHAYLWNPHDEWITNAAKSEKLDMILPRLKPRPGFLYKLLAPTTIDGKAAYVIEAKGTAKEGGASPVTINGERIYPVEAPWVTKSVDELIYIDQANFHLLQKKSTRASRGITETLVQIIQSETLDAPIPTKTFDFVIPNGAKELGKK